MGAKYMQFLIYIKNRALGRCSTILERGAGVLLIGVGGYFLWLA